MKSRLAIVLAGPFLVAGTLFAQEPTLRPAQLLAPTVAGDRAPLIDTRPATSNGGSQLRGWASAEYLLWWIKNGPTSVPLLTSAPASSQSFVPGALGNADTSVILGGQPVDHPLQHGGRFTAGTWLDDGQTWGMEANYFFLADRSVSRSASGTNEAGSAFLVNPFFDSSVNVESANFLADPLGTAGGAAVTNRSRLQGAEANLLRGVGRTENARLSVLVGFRFVQLQEGLTFETIQTDPAATFFSNQFVSTVDDFSTRNNFYGGQLGARFDYTCGRLFVQATAKVALGGTHELVSINGFTTTNTGANFQAAVPVTTVPGGIYAQLTNIGAQNRNRFAVAPEATIQVGMKLTRNISAFMGYNFLYISDVARPGNQMDRAVNSTQLVSFTGVPAQPLVGEARPAPLFNSSEYWAQGINFGLRLSW